MQLADFSAMEMGMFWRLMEFHHWAHPYNDKGERCEFSAIPKQLSDSRTTLSQPGGEVRKAGGYAKDASPYADFSGPISFARCFAKAICAAAAGKACLNRW
jgi:hypothetical protein